MTIPAGSIVRLLQRLRQPGRSSTTATASTSTTTTAIPGLRPRRPQLPGPAPGPAGNHCHRRSPRPTAGLGHAGSGARRLSGSAETTSPTPARTACTSCWRSTMTEQQQDPHRCIVGRPATPAWPWPQACGPAAGTDASSCSTPSTETPYERPPLSKELLNAGAPGMSPPSCARRTTTRPRASSASRATPPNRSTRQTGAVVLADGSRLAVPPAGARHRLTGPRASRARRGP